MFVNQAAMAEILRRHTLAANPVVTVELEAVDAGVSRARASAVFTLSVRLSWGAGVFRVMDSRGYVITWKFERIVKWLEKSLSGKRGALVIKMNDAKKLPAQWTAARIAALMRKLTVVDPENVRHMAIEKRTSVIGWSDSKRRNNILNSAAALDNFAANLQLVLDGQLPATDPAGGGDPEPGGGNGDPASGGNDFVCDMQHNHGPGPDAGQKEAKLMTVGVEVEGVAEPDTLTGWWKVQLAAGSNYLVLCHTAEEVESLGLVTVCAPCGQRVYEGQQIVFGGEVPEWIKPLEITASGTYYLRLRPGYQMAEASYYTLKFELMQ